LNAIHEILAKLTVRLHRIAARRENVLVDLKKIEDDGGAHAHRHNQVSTQLATKSRHSSQPSLHHRRFPGMAVTRMLPFLSFPMPSLMWCPQGVRHRVWTSTAAETMHRSRLRSPSWGNTEASLLPPPGALAGQATAVVRRPQVQHAATHHLFQVVLQ
jgi:hypothetical protein